LLNYLIPVGLAGPVSGLPDCSDGPHRHPQCVDIRLADATSPRAASPRCA